MLSTSLKMFPARSDQTTSSTSSQKFKVMNHEIGWDLLKPGETGTCQSTCRRWTDVRSGTAMNAWEISCIWDVQPGSRSKEAIRSLGRNSFDLYKCFVWQQTLRNIASERNGDMVEVEKWRKSVFFFGISQSISGTKDECFHFTQRISLVFNPQIWPKLHPLRKPSCSRSERRRRRRSPRCLARNELEVFW